MEKNRIRVFWSKRDTWLQFDATYNDTYRGGLPPQTIYNARTYDDQRNRVSETTDSKKIEMKYGEKQNETK